MKRKLKDVPQLNFDFPINEEIACSPPLPEKAGIAIAVPAEIPLSRYEVIPLCISWRWKHSLPTKKFNFELEVNGKKHRGSLKQYSSRLHVDYASPPADYEEDDEESENEGTLTVGGWNNINFAHSWNFPEEEGDYRVSVSYKGLYSNEASFKIHKDKKFRTTQGKTVLPIGKDTFVGDTYLAFRHGGLAEFNNDQAIVQLKPGAHKNPGVRLELVDTKSKKKEDFLIVWPGEQKLFNHLDFSIERIERNGDAVLNWSYLHKDTYLTKHPKRK